PVRHHLPPAITRQEDDRVGDRRCARSGPHPQEASPQGVRLGEEDAGARGGRVPLATLAAESGRESSICAPSRNGVATSRVSWPLTALSGADSLGQHARWASQRSWWGVGYAAYRGWFVVDRGWAGRGDGACGRGFTSRGCPDGDARDRGG